jgi:hypothetical protein
MYRLKLLYRQANCLSEASRKTLSIALVQCHFDFHCSSEYEGAGKSFRNKLQVMQNKTVRFAKKLGSRTKINCPISSNVGILNIVQQLRLNHGRNYMIIARNLNITSSFKFTF